jgi:hypothetical protein
MKTELAMLALLEERLRRNDLAVRDTDVDRRRCRPLARKSVAASPSQLPSGPKPFDRLLLLLFLLLPLLLLLRLALPKPSAASNTASLTRKDPAPSRLPPAPPPVTPAASSYQLVEPEETLGLLLPALPPEERCLARLRPLRASKRERFLGRARTSCVGSRALSASSCSAEHGASALYVLLEADADDDDCRAAIDTSASGNDRDDDALPVDVGRAAPCTSTGLL